VASCTNTVHVCQVPAASHQATPHPEERLAKGWIGIPRLLDLAAQAMGTSLQREAMREVKQRVMQKEG